MCGEQLWKPPSIISRIGSPPRVRGTAFRQTIRRWELRITPACAGNSYFRLVVVRLGQDHPRVCGEQACGSCKEDRMKGSPPRVRGTGLSMTCPSSSVGITPACAGNSDIELTGSGQNRDHPRVCGEQHLPYRQCGSGKGSPPRVRGTVCDTSTARSVYRITPACAGNRCRNKV